MQDFKDNNIEFEKIENKTYSAQGGSLDDQYNQQLIINPRGNGGYIVSAEYSH